MTAPTLPETRSAIAAALERLASLVEDLRRREDRLALVLSLVIGALVGLVVVAFVLLTGRLAAHMYPAGAAGWRRVVVPVLAPTESLLAIGLSAVLWSGGFGLYAVHYWPVLTRARLDGKPG